MWPFTRRRPTGTVLPDRSIATEKQNVAGELFRETVHNPAINQSQWPGPARFPAGRAYRTAPMGPVLYDKNGPSGHTTLFGGFVGTFHQRGARIVPVISAQGYDGILPTRQQSTLLKPEPFE